MYDRRLVAGGNVKSSLDQVLFFQRKKPEKHLDL